MMVSQIDWISLLNRDGFVPRALLTMTYGVKNSKGLDKWDPWTLSAWQVQKHWKGLVKHLNQEVLGYRYRRQVKHSYFSYLFVIEKHKSGCFHAHAIVNDFIDYAQVHDYWGKRYGFAWIRGISDPDAAIKYVVKYITKEGEPLYWHKKRPLAFSTRGSSPIATATIFPAPIGAD